VVPPSVAAPGDTNPSDATGFCSSLCILQGFLFSYNVVMSYSPISSAERRCHHNELKTVTVSLVHRLLR